MSETAESDTAFEPDVRRRLRIRTVVSSIATATLVALLVAGLIVGLGGPQPTQAIVRAVAILGWTAAGFVIWSQLRMLTPVVLGGTAMGAASALGAALLARDPAGANFAAPRVLEFLGGALAIAALLHAIVALPDGRLSSPLLRRIGALVYGICIATALALLASPPDTAHLLAELASLAVVAVVATSAVSTLSRYHQLAATDRRTGQWIGVGGALSGVLAVLVAVGAMVLRWPQDAALACLVATLPMPFAVATDGMEISMRSDRALVRVITWLGAVVTAGGITIAIVVGIGHRPVGDERGVLALGLLAGVIVLAAWEPTRRWSHGRASRFTYGDRPPPDAALTTLASRLTRAVPLGTVLDELADVLHQSQGISGAAVWTGHGSTFELAARAGSPFAPSTRVAVPHEVLVTFTHDDARHQELVLDEAWVTEHLPGLTTTPQAGRVRLAPLVHHHELLGLLAVARPSNGDPFSETDDRILGDTAVQLGLALHNAQLDSSLSAVMTELRTQAVELQASRARLVSTANAERRRIERDLHDGAQQRLVGLAVSIGLARDLLARNPTEAAEVLERVGAEVRGAIDELRSLARGIFPPLLADRGLAEAVTSSARRSPLAVDVQADLPRRYSPDMEAAVYFCCLEALQNAAKHAPDATVQVEMVEGDGQLAFVIRDDGPGFDVHAVTRGDGLTNMVDRIGALAGSVELTSAPGAGTTIRGWIPLADLAPQEG